MESVNTFDLAENYAAIHAKDLNREIEDKENLLFYDEREACTRAETKEAREQVKRLQVRKQELQAIKARCELLRRTRNECWTNGDFAFWAQVRGKKESRILKTTLVFRHESGSTYGTGVGV